MNDSLADMRRQIDELREELAYKDEVIAQLTEHERVFPFEWKLGLTETRILACMAQKGGTASMEALITAVYWMRDEPDRPEEVIKVTVAKMRHKVRPFGVDVLAVTGIGYGVDRRTAIRLQAIMAGEGDPMEQPRSRPKRRKRKGEEAARLPLFEAMNASEPMKSVA